MNFKYSNDRASLRTIRHIANSMCTYTFISVMSIPNLIAHALNTEIVLIHKSFVSTAPLGPDLIFQFLKPGLKPGIEGSDLW